MKTTYNDLTNKEVRSFNLLLLNQIPLDYGTRESINDEIVQTLNDLAWVDDDVDPRFIKYDDQVLLVDSKKHLFKFDLLGGLVYSVHPTHSNIQFKNYDASDSYNALYYLKPLKSGESSKRQTKYSYVTLFISKAGFTKRLVVPAHQILALLDNRVQFRRVFDECGFKTVVNHLDNVDYNNKANNLEWVSTRDNNLHADYVKKLVGLNPDLFVDPDRRYLKSGVQAYTLRFALTLYKTLNCDDTLFVDVFNTLGSNLYPLKICEMAQSVQTDTIDQYLSNTCFRYLFNPEFVTSSDITDDFIAAFDHFKNFRIGY